MNKNDSTEIQKNTKIRPILPIKMRNQLVSHIMKF